MIRARLLLASIVTMGWLMVPRALAQQTDASGAALQPNPGDAGDAGSNATPPPAPDVSSAPALGAPAAAVDHAGVADAPSPPAEQPAHEGAGVAQATAGPMAVSLSQPRDAHDAVRFVENHGRSVTLFEKDGDRWRRVCTSPCNFTASEGPRDYAAPVKLGPATAGYRVAGKGIWLRNGDGLQADFQDRSKIRRAGVGVLVAGLITLAFLAPALDADNPTTAKAVVLSTSGVLTLSGVIMLLMKDRVHLARCVGCNAGASRSVSP